MSLPGKELLMESMCLISVTLLWINF